VFVRVSRMQVPEIPRKPGAAFEIGKAEILHEGDDMAILANGVLVHRALEAARELAQKGIGARVLNISTISPLDEDAILACAKTGAIVTAEEHSIRGGLAGAVAELTAAHHPCRIRSLGFPGFVPTGSAEWLLKHYNLTARGIVSAALDLKSR
jgi:transketolase